VSQEPPIERAFFREDETGSTVFYPWGLAHRGYRLPDGDAKAKASRAASLLMASTIGVGTWIAYALQPFLEPDAGGFDEVLASLVAPAIVLALALLGYALWASRFTERMAESSLQVSREDRLREAAELAEPWKLASIGIALCAISAFLIGVQPHVWWAGLLGVALGLGLLAWSAVLRRAGRRADG